MNEQSTMIQKWQWNLWTNATRRCLAAEGARNCVCSNAAPQVVMKKNRQQWILRMWLRKIDSRDRIFSESSHIRIARPGRCNTTNTKWGHYYPMALINWVKATSGNSFSWSKEIVVNSTTIVYWKSPKRRSFRAEPCSPAKVFVYFLSRAEPCSPAIASIVEQREPHYKRKSAKSSRNEKTFVSIKRWCVKEG
jgi:hypothetical protein